MTTNVPFTIIDSVPPCVAKHDMAAMQLKVNELASKIKMTPELDAFLNGGPLPMFMKTVENPVIVPRTEERTLAILQAARLTADIEGMDTDSIDEILESGDQVLMGLYANLFDPAFTGPTFSKSMFGQQVAMNAIMAYRAKKAKEAENV